MVIATDNVKVVVLVEESGNAEMRSFRLVRLPRKPWFWRLAPGGWAAAPIVEWDGYHEEGPEEDGQCNVSRWGVILARPGRFRGRGTPWFCFSELAVIEQVTN